MATSKQIEANRRNAQKSTGPRTPEGKAIVAQNALKHGFWSPEVVIKGEDAEEFEIFRAGLLEELAPAGRLDGESLPLSTARVADKEVEYLFADRAALTLEVLPHDGGVHLRARFRNLQRRCIRVQTLSNTVPALQ